MINESIYLYSEQVACAPACVSELENRFKELEIDSNRVVLVPDSTYLSKALESDSDILVLPGGNALLLAHSLQPNVDSVRRVVDRGWNFLGFCAGADVACQEMVKIDYARVQIKKINFEEVECKLLNLLPVAAWTPTYHVKGNEGKVVSVTAQNETFSCFWNEGPRFQLFGPNKDNVTVEATYTNIKANAAVSADFGKGKVCLSGVHPEVCSESEDLRSDKKRQAFLHHLFRRVGI